MIIAFSAGTLIFQALIIVFLSHAHAQKLSPLTIGAVLAASGAGGALGSAAAARLLRRVTRSWVKLQTLIWFTGFTVLALPVSRQVILTAAVMAILGFAGATGNILLDTHLMRNFDKDVQARVASVSKLTALIACAAGPALGGMLVQECGINGAMTCLFLIASALPLLAVLAPTTASGCGQVAGQPELVAAEVPVPV